MAIGFKGTSIADIEQGAEDALEEDIANLSPASNSVAGNLDGGVAAVDWASKTVKSKSAGVSPPSTGETTILSVSGSGYFFYAGLGHSDKNQSDKARVYIDGSNVFDAGFDVRGDAQSPGQFLYDGAFSGTRVEFSGIFRFNSSLELRVFVDFTGPNFSGVTHYVLD